MGFIAMKGLSDVYKRQGLPGAASHQVWRGAGKEDAEVVAVHTAPLLGGIVLVIGRPALVLSLIHVYTPGSSGECRPGDASVRRSTDTGRTAASGEHPP